MTALATGAVVAGRYRIVAPLAVGGMGAVYEAEHLPSGRAMALKTLLPNTPHPPELVARLQREARAASQLDHPNVVEVYDLGPLADGGVYVAMELVRGESFRAALDRGEFPPRRTLIVMRQVLDALGHAHAHGFIHRDLKPDNVMLVRCGEPGAEYESVKLLDFGLVKAIGDAATDVGGGKLTATGMVFGTPTYMAPEAALGRPVDARVDLYAVGVILYEALVGHVPFDAPDPMQVMRMHISSVLPPIGAVAPYAPWRTHDVEILVERALAKRPEARWPDAAAMVEALDAAFRSLDHLPEEA